MHTIIVISSANEILEAIHTSNYPRLLMLFGDNEQGGPITQPPHSLYYVWGFNEIGLLMYSLANRGGYDYL